MSGGKDSRLLYAALSLAFGGLGMVIILCLLIGFGFHTFVGKEALYIGFVMQLPSILLLRRRERRAVPLTAPLRTAEQISLWLWRFGALLFTVSLLLALCGLRFGSFWVKYTCVSGAIAVWLGWLGEVVVRFLQGRGQKARNATH